MSSVRQPKDIVEEFIAARNSHDHARASRLLAEDLEWRLPRSVGESLRGIRARKALAGGLSRQLLTAGSEHLHVKRVLLGEDRVVVEYTLTGTTTQGAPYSGEYCGVFDVRGDLIARVTSYTDTRAAALAFGEEALENAVATARGQ